jgi:hypothetical protein
MRRRTPPWTALVLACAGVLWATAAIAQQVELEPPDGKDDAEHPSGVYTGVKPGGNEAPAVPVKAGATPATVTWPGFQMQPDGSSRVFLQTSVAVASAGSLQKGSFVVELGDAPIAGDTNRFPLLTQHFNTPVTRVELKRAKGRTTLVLTLRADVQPQVSTEQAKSGFFFLYVDFPAGNYLGITPSGPPAPRPTDGTALDSAPPAPSHIEGDASASGGASAQGSASVDSELPPGVAAPKAKAKAKASGKAKVGF